MTRHKILERIENSTALAITGRERLTDLADMLHNIHRQGRPLSDYNLHIATEDIAQTVTILHRLQDELCQFKGERT